MSNFTLQKPDGKRTKHILTKDEKAFKCGRPFGPQSKYGNFPVNTYIENEDNGCCDECAQIDTDEELGEFYDKMFNETGFDPRKAVRAGTVQMGPLNIPAWKMP